MTIFYSPDIKHYKAVLDENESGHAIKVLRLKQGDRVELVDGKGHRFLCAIEEAHPKRCQVSIIESLETATQNTTFVHLTMAPTKNSDRTEWLIEKATEIGISEFTPVLCRHSERKNIQTNRLRKIAIAAMKQSGRAFLPAINEMLTFEEVINLPFDGLKLIAHCHAGEKAHISSLLQKGEPVWILIGPEGDFSEEEIALAKNKGFKGTSLGSARLRTETAALIALAAVALYKG